MYKRPSNVQYIFNDCEKSENVFINGYQFIGK